MASTVGHALVGVALYQRLGHRGGGDGLRVSRRAALVASAALANLPDLDFVLGYLVYRDPHSMHSGVSHTIPAVLAVSLLFALTRLFGSFARTFLLSLVILLSHVMLDFLAGRALGFADGYGVMLLYPFSEARFSSPFKLLLGPRHRTLQALLSPENALVVLWELALFLPLVLYLSRARDKRVLPAPPDAVRPEGPPGGRGPGDRREASRLREP